MKKSLPMFILSALLVFGLLAPVFAQDADFSGQTVVVVTQTGRSIGGPVEDFAPEWEAATGGQVQLQQFAFGELFEKMISSFETGAASYDVLIFPADWAGDFMGPGFLEPISTELQEKLDWEDVVPLYRERLTSWGDDVFALPYDGDAHMMYYRKDLINDPEFASEFAAEYGYELAEPESWDQYRDIAEFFNLEVVETDGVMAPIFGALEAQRRNAQSYWVYLSRAAGYGKIPGNPCFFFSCDDMTPQVNNPGWVRALEDYIEIREFGDPNMINYDVSDTRSLFPAGASVLNIDWGDVGTISIDESASVVKGDVGFAALPGGVQYWDYEAGEWVTPEDGVNQAPFIAFGGWIIGVAADSDVKEAALDFAAFMARPELVQQLAVTGGTGINPSRYSQLEDIEPWIEAGFDRESAQDYLEAIRNTIDHPNAVLDLRIRGASEYFQALDAEVSRALVGEIDPQTALDNVASLWDDITERFGREGQLDQYRNAVGFQGE